MAPKRNRRRVRSGEAEMLSETSSGSDSGKKNASTVSQRRSIRIKKMDSGLSSTSIESAYDGDGETTCSTRGNYSSSSTDQTMSSPGSDMYDFNEEDDIPSRGILSPKQAKVKKKRSQQKPVKKKNVSGSGNGKWSSKTNKTRTSSGTPVGTKEGDENKLVRKPKGMKTPGVSPILSCSRLDSSAEIKLTKSNKRKAVNTTSNTPVLPSKSKHPRIEALKDESGIFVSPPAQKKSRLVAKDTSTPANSKDSVDNKCFGFDSLGSPHCVSITSDYGSAVMDLSQISMDDSAPVAVKDFEVSMFSEPVVEPEPDLQVNLKSVPTPYKVSKSKRPKGRYSTGRVDAWADKMNQEFEDAENFELSIEG